MVLNPNQFQQVPIPGQLDLQITRGGTLSGMIASSVTDSLPAGSPVKLDSTNTGPLPKFVAADDDDDFVFILPYSDKQDSYTGDDPVEVPCFLGPVLWAVAGEAITPGAVLEQANTTFKWAPVATHSPRAIALDPAAADGDLFRIFLISPVALAS